MGVCNSWNEPFRSPEMFRSLLMITLIFFLIIPYATPLNFSFPSISSNDGSSINTTGDAYLTPEGILLTPNDRDVSRNLKVGRATYTKPLHLWNSDSLADSLTDFNTHFSFVIDSNGATNYGDGLAFFLAPNGSNIPPNSTGSSLGLTSTDKVLNSSENHFVAVEFDTFRNPDWDPEDNSHVGININSMASVANVSWSDGYAYNPDVLYGNITEVWISYDSSLKNLSVVFTRLNRTSNRTLSYGVDLKACLPEWVTFGFSSAIEDFFEKNIIKSWEFNSTQIVHFPPPPPSSPAQRQEKKNNTGLVVVLFVGSCVLVGVLASAGFGMWRKRGKREIGASSGIGEFEDSTEDDFDLGIGPRNFTYGELSGATNEFSEEQKLGEGGFGGVYRGFLRKLNSDVAVKRISRGSKQGIKEYASEVTIIGRLRHKNLVQLIGWCHEKREFLLVYEFMPNGSLDFHLFKGKICLSWAVRYKIAQGLASALLYLHEGWEQCVVHGDIKSSNIMLDSNFDAKLGDWGLARLVDHGKGSQTTVLAETMGYMAPECIFTGKASKESDVYSFGVVTLEITCGRRPVNPSAPESQIRMVDWVWDLYGIGKLLEAADLKLGADFNEKEMERLMIVGLWCAHPESNLRPSIMQAIQALNFEAPLPVLPSEMPVATYLAPSRANSSFSLANDASVSGSSQIQLSSYNYSTDCSKLGTFSSSASSPFIPAHKIG